MKKPILNLEEVLMDRVMEEDLLEVPLKSSVFKMFFILSVFLGLLAFFQLINLGILKNKFYTARASINMRYVETFPAPRGVIYDRHGVQLLQNAPSLNIFLSPKDLPKNSDMRLAILEKISEVLGVDKEKLYDEISKKDWSLSDRLLLRKDVSDDEAVKMSSLNIPGLKIEPNFKRVYKNSLVFSHVLGFTGLVAPEDLKENPDLLVDDKIGRAGLEAYYDSYLRGKTGKEFFLKNAEGHIKGKESYEPPEPGYKLETSLDSDFQEYFWNRLDQGLRALGRDSGVGIAINPQNGEVLALFSIPSYDPSSVSDFLDKNNKPLFNRAVSGLYNPGSTIKPLVATAALSENIVKPDKQIFSAGFIEVPNPYDKDKPSRFLDWKRHGWVDLYSALARSSNVYFYEIGGGFQDQPGLGIEKLKSWWEKFGLSDLTHIDLPNEVSGFLPTPQWKEKALKDFWRIGDTYNVTIGQGDLVITPLELLNYISAIASGGKIYEPHIVKRIVSKEGIEILESQRRLLKDLSPEINSVVKEVQKGMRDAVSKSYGTAHLLSDLPIEVAAKTGTAQVNNNTKTNAFFVGYAPYDNPELAVLVLVENSREGSLNTVPIARDVFMWYYNNRLKK